jgi:hypothetical protein
MPSSKHRRFARSRKFFESRPDFTTFFLVIGFALVLGIVVNRFIGLLS